MAQLEEIVRGSAIRGTLPDRIASVLDVKWIGTVAIEVTYKDSTARLASELLDREPTLKVAVAGRTSSVDGNRALVRLVPDAHRVRLNTRSRLAKASIARSVASQGFLTRRVGCSLRFSRFEVEELVANRGRDHSESRQRASRDNLATARPVRTCKTEDA